MNFVSRGAVQATDAHVQAPEGTGRRAGGKELILEAVMKTFNQPKEVRMSWYEDLMCAGLAVWLVWMAFVGANALSKPFNTWVIGQICQ
jgi:hypothetical protein